MIKRHDLLLFLLAIGLSGSAMAMPITPTDTLRGLIQQSRFEEATVVSKRLQQSHRANAQTYYWEGIAMKNLCRFSRAIQSFSQSYRMDSLCVDNLSELGACYKAMNDYGNALFFYEQAYRKNATSNALAIELATVNMAAEKYDRALILFRRLYDADSDNVYFLRNMAKCYDCMGQEDSAMILYRKSLQPINGDFQTVYRLCCLWIKHKAYDKALAMTTEFRCTDSTNARINSLHAYLFLLKRDYSSANRLFEHCYKHHDETKFTLKYLGISAFKINDMESAKTYLEKAYQQDSTDYEISNYLGVACSSSFYKRLGVYYLEKALQLTTPDSVYLGTIYGNLGRAYETYSNAPREKALKAYLKAYSLNPQDTVMLYLIACQYDHGLHDTDKAINYYRQFLSVFPPERKNKKEEVNVITYYNLATRRLKELTHK
jgi:tetratricopeptide (TPR) repeat protein